MSTALTPVADLMGRRTVTPLAPGSADVEFEASEDWLQGRTSFGGLIAAFGVQAMRDAAGADWGEDVGLRALQTSFVAPVGGGPLSVQARLLRAGKQLRQVQATLVQGNQVAAVMLGVFGNDRASSMRTVRPTAPAATHAPASLPVRRLLPGAPQFVRHFDMRWDHGPMPGAGSPLLHTRIHLRLQHAQGLPPELITVMLADASPTPATGQFHQPPPASSVSWALELRPLREPPAADGWWRADNESMVVEGGLVNHTSRLWAPSGELAGLSSQLVTVFG